MMADLRGRLPDILVVTRFTITGNKFDLPDIPPEDSAQTAALERHYFKFGLTSELNLSKWSSRLQTRSYTAGSHERLVYCKTFGINLHRTSIYKSSWLQTLPVAYNQLGATSLQHGSRLAQSSSFSFRIGHDRGRITFWLRSPELEHWDERELTMI